MKKKAFSVGSLRGDSQVCKALQDSEPVEVEWAASAARESERNPRNEGIKARQL